MPQLTNVPFYCDWSFWAVAFAALALLLSQLPPIHMLLKRAKLELEVYSRIHLTHKVGNPNVQLHLIISSVGGKAVKVKDAIVSIKRDGKHIADLPAQNYLQDPNDKSTVLFTTFSLKPKEEWAHIVNFLNLYSRLDEKAYRSAESALKANISDKRLLPENKEKLVEADSEYVSPFIDMFKFRFVWQPGEYEIKVSIDAVPQISGISKTYRLTLFESDSNDLAKAQDDFKYGDGTYWVSDKHPGVIVQLIEA